MMFIIQILLYFYLMKKNNKNKPQLEISKTPLMPPIVISKTHAEISQQLLQNVQQKFAQKLQIGKISINNIKTTVQSPKVQEINGALNIQDIEQSLKLMKNNILQQKRIERLQQRSKLMKAQQFITKMKKEKQLYENNLKEKQQSHRDILHKKIFSQSIINKMRERLQGKIIQKRQQIQQRIKSIELRKKERQEHTLQQQMSYWQKLKEVSKKQSKSSVKLPSLYKSDSLQLPKLNRKNSLQNIKIQSRQMLAKPIAYMSQRLDRYDEIINTKLNKIKIKKQKLNKVNPQLISDGLMANGRQISQNNTSIQQLKNSKLHVNKDFVPYSVDKFKLFGNQYLKESLLIIKKNNTPVQNNTLQNQEEKDLEVSINLAHINKNQKIEKLQQKWERALSKIQHKEVQMQQGLQLINSIQKRLDKVDIQNISSRLKKKCQIFDKLKYDTILTSTIQIK